MKQLSIWQRFTMQPPPAHLSDELVHWVANASERLYVTFAETPGLSSSDLAELVAFCGVEPPRELIFFYKFYNPWNNFSEGLSHWKRLVNNAITRHLHGSDTDIDERRSMSQIPTLWPISFGNREDVVAFLDDQERLIVVGIDTHGMMTQTRAVGMLGYFSSIVLVELLLDANIYQSHEVAAQDGSVREVSGWKSEFPLVHPLIS
jgi:hypothetical protein